MSRIVRMRDKIGKDAQLAVFESFRLQLDTENELTVCGCESLRDISETYICIACSDRIVELWGKDLQIVVFDDTELRFCGDFEKIGFCRLTDLHSETGRRYTKWN